MNGKLIIFSAPSGSGKSTIIGRLKEAGFDFGFSISATSRAPRGTEQHGVEYYFLTPDEFRAKIANGERRKIKSRIFLPNRILSSSERQRYEIL